MAIRTFTPNTVCNTTGTKVGEITPLEASRAGHVLQVHADLAIFDTNTGDFVDPLKVRHNSGRIGLSQ